MKNLQKILVATDGSSFSKEAIEMTKLIAKVDEPSITVLFVQEDYHSKTGEINSSQKEADKILNEAKQILSTVPNVSYETFVGSAFYDIVSYIADNNIDLVIIGHRGVSGVKKIVMGSISERVTSKARCSVLVVK